MYSWTRGGWGALHPDTPDRQNAGRTGVIGPLDLPHASQHCDELQAQLSARRLRCVLTSRGRRPRRSARRSTWTAFGQLMQRSGPGHWTPFDYWDTTPEARLLAMETRTRVDAAIATLPNGQTPRAKSKCGPPTNCVTRCGFLNLINASCYKRLLAGAACAVHSRASSLEPGGGVMPPVPFSRWLATTKRPTPTRTLARIYRHPRRAWRHGEVN